MTTEEPKTVLIVDDEKELLLTLHDFFISYEEHFTIKTASNGLEALDILEKDADISLLITDIKMPKMDGLTLLSHMINKFPTIPCIVFTAFGTPELTQKLDSYGVLYSLDKPFKLETLASYVFRILKESRHTGFLNAIALESFLILLEIEMKSGVVSIAHKPSGVKGYLYLSKGKLIHAQFEKLSGEDAVIKILNLAKPELEISVTFKDIDMECNVPKRLLQLINENQRQTMQNKIKSARYSPSFSTVSSGKI